MEVKKVSLYTYMVLLASMFLWFTFLGFLGANISQVPSIHFWLLFSIASGCMLVVAAGLTMIRGAVGLDVLKKKVD